MKAHPIGKAPLPPSIASVGAQLSKPSPQSKFCHLASTSRLASLRHPAWERAAHGSTCFAGVAEGAVGRGGGLLAKTPFVSAAAAAQGAASSSPACAWQRALQPRQLHTWQPWAQKTIPSGGSAGSSRPQLCQLMSLRQFNMRRQFSTTPPPKPAISQHAKARMDAADKKSDDQIMYLVRPGCGLAACLLEALGGSRCPALRHRCPLHIGPTALPLS